MIRIRGSVVGSLTEKSLGSTRAGTKQNGIEALLWFIELDTPEPVIEDMIPFLSHKLPKLVAGVTAGLTEIYRVFGAQTVSPKLVVKLIPKLFTHADKMVRKEATGLAVELYKWLGDGFSNAILPDLKPVQQKELSEEFDKLKGQTPHQERYLRSQREALERQQLSGFSSTGQKSTGGMKEEASEDNSLDFLEATEVFSKIPNDFATRLASAKWKDRKEALEEVYPIVKVPKIKSEDYSEIMRLFAKCMKDANIQVVALAAHCIESFAQGLRSEFARYIPTVLNPMLERLKEKKATVTEALTSALDAVYQTGSLSEILDEVLEFLGHKTPQVKIETAKFLSRCLSATKVMPKPSEIKSIVTANVKLLADTQEPVRTAAAEVLGVVMKLMGERAMAPYLESVDDIKKGKIMEYYATAEVNAKPGKETPTAQVRPAASKPGATSRAASSGLTRKRPASAAPPPANMRLKYNDNPEISQAKPSLQPPSQLSRTGASSALKSKAHEVASGASSSQRPGTINRGLTGRSLMTGKAPPPVDNSISAAEKAELDQLREQKAKWDQEKETMSWQQQEDNTEKARLMKEINTLQSTNSQLADEHTRDILAIKSKETQLVRAVSDFEASRRKIAQLEEEIERLKKSQLPHSSVIFDRQVSSLSPTKAANSNFTSPRRAKLQSQTRQSAIPPASTMPLSDARSLNSRQTMSALEVSKDTNQFGGPTRYGVRNPVQANGEAQSAIPAFNSTRRHVDENSATGHSLHDNSGSNWKRAAEVTVQLKARIEAMKARQNQNRAFH